MRKPNNPIDALFMLREKFDGDIIICGRPSRCPPCLYADTCENCRTIFGPIFGYNIVEDDGCSDSDIDWQSGEYTNIELREYLDAILTGLGPEDRKEIW